MRIAASLASLPVLSRITFCSCGGRSAGELAAQLDDLGRQDPAEQVDRALAAARDRADHVRMVVAERRAHLAGGEVEDAPAAVVVDVRRPPRAR